MKTHTMQAAYLRRGWILLSLLLVSVQVALATIEITNTTFTSIGQCDGSIEATAAGDAGPFVLSLVGDNGSAEYTADINGAYTFGNLCAGSYTLSVMDAYGCLSTLTVEISECPEITMQPSNIKPPTSCNSFNGAIRFLSGGAEGGISPYTYLWENGSTQLLHAGLSDGIYFLTATDAVGCTGTFSYEIFGGSTPQLVVSDVQPACEGVANGSITIAVFIEDFGGDFTYEWSSGISVDNNNISELNDIAVGDYSVTVTETNSGCHSSFSFTVPETPSEGEFTVDLNIARLSCFGAATGIISINVTGGNSPYRIEGSDGSVIPSSQGGAAFSQLSAGTYYFDVYDDCGRYLSKSILLDNFPAMDINLDGEGIFGCPGTGEIDLLVSGGSPPFAYEWSNGQTTEDATGLFNETYTITVTDNEGCTASESYAAFFGDASLVEEDPPCEGFVGSATFNIEKVDDNHEVYYSIDGSENILIPSLENPLSYTIGNLDPNQEYNFLFSFGDCTYPVSVQLGVRPTDKEFVGVVNDIYCEYNESCDGIDFGPLYINATYDIEAFEEGWLKCKAPIICDGIDTGKKRRFKKRIVSVAEYRSILNQAFVSTGFNSEYIGFLQSTVSSYLPCDKVKYCPASLKSSNHWGGWPGEAIFPTPTLDNGCIFVDCKFPRLDIHYCLNDLDVPAGFLPTEQPLTCLPRTFNFYNIIRYYDYLMENEPIFPGSELRNYMDLYYYDASEEERKKTYCAIISFCRTDFSVYYTDVENVVCGVPIDPNYCVYNPDNPLPPCETCQKGPVIGTDKELVWCTIPSDAPLLIPPIKDGTPFFTANNEV
ncbi:MAG TPA: hypothetical protein ENJ95_18135 [Bacteroidetes bacterium]|nr:hypothetical protein [Bacteroidota bacterium]